MTYLNNLKKQDFYAYISESDKFDEFSNLKSLYWSLTDIEYGNWYGGDNNDGNFVFSNQIELTEVLIMLKL